MYSKVFYWTPYNFRDYFLTFTLNSLAGKYSIYEIGNHADLVPAPPSDLLSDYVSHSGPKLHLLFLI